MTGETEARVTAAQKAIGPKYQGVRGELKHEWRKAGREE